jgi:tetratricopeptide (TPR) repeat protein
VRQWILPMMVGLIASAPVAAMASGDQPSSRKGTIAQATNPVRQNPTDKAWELIRTARRDAANNRPEQATQVLVQAEQTARLLSNSVTLDQLLGTIAAEQAKLGRYDRAIAITNSMSYTTMPPNTCCIPVRTAAEIAIAEAYLKAGQISQAQQYAERIQSAPARNQVLIPIVAALADRGQFAEAIALSKRTSDQANRANYEVVKGYINADRFPDALQFIKTIPDPSERSSLFTVLSQWAARSGKYDLSYQIANQIQEPGAKVQLFAEVAQAYAQAGQRERAVSILSQAYEIARKQPDQQAFAQWAGNFARIGAFDRAVTIANRLQPFDKAEARLAIARAYSNGGQYSKAIAMAQLVKDGELQVVGDIPDPKVDTVQQIVKQAAKAKQYDLAIRAANSFEKGQHRVSALRTIAEQYRLAKQPQKAAAVLDQAITAAKTVDRITIFYDRNTFFAVSNAGLLVDIARDYRLLNQPDQVMAVLGEALKSARTLKEPNVNSVQEQIKYLSTIAKFYVQLNQRDRALVAAESALTLVDQLPKEAQAYYPLWQVQALANAAQIFHIAGVESRANEMLTRARTSGDTIRDNQQKAWARVPIVQAYAAMGAEPQVKEIVESTLKLAQAMEAHQRDWLTDRLTVAAASSDPAYAIQLAYKIPDRARRVPILAQMAVNYHATGQDPQAQAVVISLQQVAATIPSDDQREQVLSDVIRSYYAPQNARGLSVGQLLQAGQITADIQSPNLRAASWALIAQASATQGEPTRANQTMGFALDAVKTIPNRFDRRDLLWQLFEEALRTDERSLAAQIAAAFEEASYRSTALQRVKS